MFAVFFGGLVWKVLLLVGGLTVLCYGMRYAIQGRRESRRKPEEARAEPSFDWQLRLATTGHTIDSQKHLPSHTKFTLTNTQNAVYSCLQHAQAARRPRLPRPAAREGPAPPVHAQDEVSRQRSYRKKHDSNEIPMLTPIAEGGALRFVSVALKKQHPNSTTNTAITQPTPSPSASVPSRRSPSSSSPSASSWPSPSAPLATAFSASSGPTRLSASPGLVPRLTRRSVLRALA